MEPEMQMKRTTFFNIHFIIWTSAVLYSIYMFFLSSASFFRHYDDAYGDFKTNSFITSRKKDVSDDEWETVLQVLNVQLFCLVASILFSEVLRKMFPVQVLQVWQIISSVLLIIYELNYSALFIILFFIIVFETAKNLNRKIAIWICTVSSIIIISATEIFAQDHVYEWLAMTHRQYYILLVLIHWNILRCTSYYIDMIETKEEHSFLQIFSYCLYLPLLQFGPFVRYAHFRKAYCNDLTKPLQERLIQLIKNVIRFGFWLIFLEIFLHFIYVNAAGFQPKFVASLDSWSLYGYGYCMGQFFHIKYVVVYGLATSIAKFENVTVPETPRCIGRIHLYSDMWRYFDPGLYDFLTRYIYIPTIKNGTYMSKILASFVCFLFVYAWHGTQNCILIWSVLNFIGVLIEIAFRYYYSLVEKHKILQQISPYWKQNFACILASPLLAMSAVSNFYFFAGTDIGNIFAIRFLKNSASENILLLFFLYNCCQVSTVLKACKIIKKKV